MMPNLSSNSIANFAAGVAPKSMYMAPQADHHSKFPGKESQRHEVKLQLSLASYLRGFRIILRPEIIEHAFCINTHSTAELNRHLVTTLEIIEQLVITFEAIRGILVTTFEIIEHAFRINFSTAEFEKAFSDYF